MENEIVEILSMPFEASRIHWRIGSTTKDKSKGMALAFLDARDVMQRLDDVVGPRSWQCRYPFSGCCEISLKFGEEWVVKANGAGQTEIEAEKGQYSTAFKRAAVLWGIGRYLYDLPSPWVALENRRIPKATHQKLTERLEAWQKERFGD